MRHAQRCVSFQPDEWLSVVLPLQRHQIRPKSRRRRRHTLKVAPDSKVSFAAPGPGRHPVHQACETTGTGVPAPVQLMTFDRLHWIPTGRRWDRRRLYGFPLVDRHCRTVASNGHSTPRLQPIDGCVGESTREIGHVIRSLRARLRMTV